MKNGVAIGVVSFQIEHSSDVGSLNLSSPLRLRRSHVIVELGPLPICTDESPLTDCKYISLHCPPAPILVREVPTEVTDYR